MADGDDQDPPHEAGDEQSSNSGRADHPAGSGQGGSAGNDGGNNWGDDPLAGLAGIPMFSEIARQLQGQGPLNWEAARQFAILGASNGESESNVDPAVRIALTSIADIVGPHVNDITGLGLAFPSPQTVTRSQWAADTLTAYRPLLTDLAVSLNSKASGGDAETDPMGQMLANLNQMFAPAMLGMAVGSMVGTLAQRAFGLRDLPIPRTVDGAGLATSAPATSVSNSGSNAGIVLVPTNIDAFANEWSLSLDEVRLWVVANEMAGYSVFSIGHLRDTVATLVRQHVASFEANPDAVAERLSSLEVSGDPTEAVQQLFSDPELLLGAVNSPAQLEMQPRIDAIVAMVVGYTDWIVDAVSARLVGGDALAIAEAARRRRVEAAKSDVMVERLLGIRVGHEVIARGKAFIQGVVDRVGESGLTDLLLKSGSEPTPNEIDAPGLWIARVSET